ncbi:hypothetical protein KC343_g17905 [Hortaea werneckii]|uniref:Uncharacterized protein n=1 Tax=Hortaea werneckii TaxID=91943 RepID=A0A3M7FRJ0_HORWE|nr:hypothetical protein KC338_g8464 [Hortaea werneckii]KAI6871874.1 hypothetical protein KC323_g1809 [Hortaea werneckii]KAI7121916.1 hypothetical protein KC352_g32825 [Hortaea werneckii]KAI7345151.1 hypothetical protein KC320_g8461 [Hortaea werneckii]KAI7537825.1 hypothetical protein KC317_g17984 [Hortaea werneckii]
MSGRVPEPYPAPPHTRSRQSSTASLRYHPDNQPAPHQAPPPPSGYPYAYGKPAPPTTMPPVERRRSYGPRPSQALPPEELLHPESAAYPGNPPYPVSDAEIPVQPPRSSMGPRKDSHSSTHSRRSRDSHYSRRSHDSRRSRDSHRSRRSRHSSGKSSDEEYDRERRHRRHEDRERRQKHDRDYEKPLKRTDTSRPTIGGTLYAVFDGLKAVLGPRDKY